MYFHLNQSCVRHLSQLKSKVKHKRHAHDEISPSHKRQQQEFITEQLLLFDKDLYYIGGMRVSSVILFNSNI